MTDLRQLMPIAIEAMDIAARIISQQEPKTVTFKGDRDMVSDIDVTVERSVRSYLSERAPQVGFLGEEEGSRRGESGLFWALDPVDGTANFVQGIPLYAVSLGLIEDQSPVLGVIDVPEIKGRYTAVRGHGAFHHGERIHVRTPSRLKDAIVTIGDYAIGDDADARNKFRLAVTRELAGRVLRVRMLGSAAIDLAWLAHGRTDAAINFSNKPWDTAAGVVIAREAGAIVTDRDGTPHNLMSTSTIGAHESLISQVVDLLGVAANTSSGAGKASA